MRSLYLDVFFFFKNGDGRIEKNESKFMNFKSVSISSMMGSKARLYVTITMPSQKETFFGVFFFFVLVSLLLRVSNL